MARLLTLQRCLKAAAVAEAGRDELRPALEPPDGLTKFPAEFVQVVAAAVPGFAVLQDVPDALAGIEVRRVAGPRRAVS